MGTIGVGHFLSGELALAKLYSGAMLTVVSSKRGQFGRSCAESLCWGTPFAGFENEGSESIAVEEYSEFVDYRDVTVPAERLFMD